MTAAERAAVALAEAAVDWVDDTGECHFCAYNRDGQTHDSDCPVEAYEAAKLGGAK